jgi:prevent-host-death family protein
MPSVAETKNHLSELIDRAIGGEEVVITRHGAPVAVLRGIAPRRGPVTDDDLAWLDANRVSGTAPKEDAGAATSRLRDEDWR